MEKLLLIKNKIWMSINEISYIFFTLQIVQVKEKHITLEIRINRQNFGLLITTSPQFSTLCLISICNLP